MAAMKGNLENVRDPVGKGADINIKNGCEVGQDGGLVTSL